MEVAASPIAKRAADIASCKRDAALQSVKGLKIGKDSLTFGSRSAEL